MARTLKWYNGQMTILTDHLGPIDAFHLAGEYTTLKIATADGDIVTYLNRARVEHLIADLQKSLDEGGERN
jgi:hypothetical protein